LFKTTAFPSKTTMSRSTDGIPISELRTSGL